MKFFTLTALTLILLWLSPPVILAQESLPLQDFKKARVLKIIEEGEKQIFDSLRPYQLVEVQILEGDEKDRAYTIEHGANINLKAEQRVKNGDVVVLYRSNFQGQTEPFQIIDKYRLDVILKLLLGFSFLILIVSRFKGLGSIIGLALSFLVIFRFILPQIIKGSDPVTTSIIGCSVIILTSIFFAHGLSKRTGVAVFATIISLTVTGILSSFFIGITHLSGLGNEAAYSLTFGPQTSLLNFKGLLLAGIIIGTLGVLDDVTTTQSATIFELARANHKLSFWELFNRGMVVGKEHISSLINTLVLAYTGAALPLMLIIILNPSQSPLWFIINNEPIAEEIVRTVGGSIGLILAVPITTIIASYFASGGKLSLKKV